MTHPTETPKSRKYHHGDLRQTLIDAGLAIVTKEQNWNFSLREVARRAGVSHNAPYNHFQEKRDLLDAVAAVGFDKLRRDMLGAEAGTRDAASAMLAIAQAYVSFATSNPALYRLMFGPELVGPDGARPHLARTSGAGAKMVLQDVVLRGAKDGLFAVSAESETSLSMAVMAVWSIVHGSSMLIVDTKADTGEDTATIVAGVITLLLEGLRRR
jgi:AcrR family transcriptional regulator